MGRLVGVYHTIALADHSYTNREVMSVHNRPEIHRWMKDTAVLIHSSCQGMRVEGMGAKEESRNSELNSF